MTRTNDPEVIRRLLTSNGRWAVVGLSENRERAAYGVSRYLQGIGKTIVPVHPKAPVVHGETGYASLADVPGQVDVVDVFVRSELAGAVVDDAIAIAEASGGSVAQPKQPITATSWWAVIVDPDGNHIGLTEGTTEI